MKALFLALFFLIYSWILSLENECVIISHPNADRVESFRNGCREFSYYNTSFMILQVDTNKLAFELVIEYLRAVKGMIDDNCYCERVKGIVGDFDSATAGIIHKLISMPGNDGGNKTAVVMVAPGSPSSQPVNTQPITSELSLPNLFHINPLENYIQAFFALASQQNWTRIVIINENALYYQQTAEILKRRLTHNDTLGSRVLLFTFSNDDKKSVFDGSEWCGAEVIVYVMGEINFCLLQAELDTIVFEQLWMKLDSDLPVAECSLIGDVTVLTDLSGSVNVPPANFNSDFNFTDGLLLDSLLMVAAFTEDTTANISLEGANRTIQFKNGKRLSNISVLLLWTNGSLSELGHYSSESKQLNISFYPYSRSPVCNPRKYFQNTAMEITFTSVIFTLCFIFITATLILFIYFRKEKEIKATSFTISLFMFTGSFLMIFTSFLMLIEAQPASKFFIPGNAMCQLMAWMNGLGFPIVLIYATLFVKIFRVHLIFSDPFSLRKKLFSDRALFFYIVLLTSPTILILTLWTGISPWKNVYVEVPDGYFKTIVYERCSSKGIFIWGPMQLFYLGILIVSVVILAIKTSKIHHKNFQDTKSTNIFTFLTIFATIITVFFVCFYSQLVPSVRNHWSRHVALYFYHTVVAVACPLFLFARKVYAAARRRYFPDEVQPLNANPNI